MDEDPYTWRKKEKEKEKKERIQSSSGDVPNSIKIGRKQ
jgi:hypothetical protein